MTPPADGERILLSGPPHNTKAVIPVSTSEVVATVTLKLPDGPAMHRAYLRPLGASASQLRLKLPRDTPPGTYRGEVVVGKEARGVVVQVSPTVRTRVDPGQTMLEVAPGGHADFEIIVSNNGNVPVEVPEQSALDLDDAVGQERALGAALRADLGREEKRVDRYFDELRRTHGGEASVSVLKGAGTLEPGDARVLNCRVQIPKTVEPDRNYAGAWPIASTSHVLAITAAPAEGGSTWRQPQ